jgi:hypothetical protein
MHESGSGVLNLQTYELFPSRALFVCCDFICSVHRAMSLRLNNKSSGWIVLPVPLGMGKIHVKFMVKYYRPSSSFKH